MITPGDIKRAEYCIRESGVIGILQEGMSRSTRGRKANLKKLELLFIGMLLSVQERGLATITSAHRILTEDLPFAEQLRLGVRGGTPEKPRVLSLSDCYYQVEIVTTRLAYGHGSRLINSREENERRRNVINRFNDALMDVFATPVNIDDTTVAIDSTGIWAWHKGGAYEPPTAEEVARIEDPVVREKLLEAIQLGELTGDGFDAETIRLMKQTVDKSTKSVDQDAGWGGKTSKNGLPEPFFGYMVHALANVPKSKIADDPSAQPVLVRRFEVTRASDDVVDPTLRLIDSLPELPQNILVDRHYNYKEYNRWQKQLIKRGIRQHFDLRSDDHGVVLIDDIPFIDGCAHCPAMPSGKEDIQRPSVFAPKEAHDTFHESIEDRCQYAMVAINQQNENRRIKYRCPAAAGKVGCVNQPGSLESAARLGKPIIENPCNEVIDGSPLPRCCSGDSFWIQLSEPVAKINQPKYWGSREWLATWQLRTYIEGVFGNFKNPSTENLHRGTMQIKGLVWVNITMGIILTAFDLRSLRTRQLRSGEPDSSHVLLERDPGVQPWGYLSEKQIESEWEKHLFEAEALLFRSLLEGDVGEEKSDAKQIH